MLMPSLRDYLVEFPCIDSRNRLMRPFRAPEQLLEHMIGTPQRLALGIPADPSAGRSKWYMPTHVDEGEVPELVRQHLLGRIERRLGVSKGTKISMVEGARWLGAYAVHQINRRPIAWWIAIDVDVKAADHATGVTQQQADAIAMEVCEVMRQSWLCPVLERSHSGRGWHIWAVFADPVPGPFAAWLAAGIADAVAKRMKLPPGVRPEAFPKNGNPRGLGVPVALPLTGAPRGKGGGAILRSDLSALPIEEVTLVSDDVLHVFWLPLWRRYEAASGQLAPRHWGAQRRPTNAGVSCERVMRVLAPGRITDSTADELYCKCPRHDWQSGRSLHVNRKGRGWLCRRCNRGGHALELVAWLLSEGASAAEIDAELRRVEAAS